MRDDECIEFADEAPDELPCTHCNGEGLCWDGADPLLTCPDEPHPCHACHGSGARKDQVIF
jgi:DnaJ-class molecular chaperone